MMLYFHIDELGRDAIVASALKLESRRRGWKLVFGNRASSVFIKYLNVFDAIILPSVVHFKAYFPDRKNVPNNVFILPTEAVGQATGSLRRMNAKYFGIDESADAPWHEAVRGFLLWGHAHLYPFNAFYPEYLDRCRVVGHPRLAEHCLGSTAKEMRNKKTIGFISRFGKLNPYDRRDNMSLIFEGMKDVGRVHATYENSPEMDIEDMLYTEAMDLRIMFLIMKELARNESYEFLIKPHPREDAGRWRDFIKKHKFNARVYDWDVPFASWLGEVDYIVGPPSTSFYDILAQGRKPICTDQIFLKRAQHILTESDDNNQILDYVCRPKSINELLYLIENDCVPEVAPGVADVLEGQTALSIAKGSDANVLDAIGAMTFVNEANKSRLLIISATFMYFMATYVRAYAEMIVNLFRAVDEQGSTFYLTVRRARWINRLSNCVTAGSKFK